jgi:hypothetical protein
MPKKIKTPDSQVEIPPQLLNDYDGGCDSSDVKVENITPTRPSMSNRYELAHQKVLAGLTPWKRNAVIEDSKMKKDNSRLVKEFTDEVIKLAESDAPIFLT